MVVDPSKITFYYNIQQSTSETWSYATLVPQNLIVNSIPRPSSYPLSGPKYLLLGTISPQLRVQGGSWFNWARLSRAVDPPVALP